MSDVTRILNAIEQGDTKVVDKLLPAVYQELRQLAAQKLSREKPGQTLQATALVHEAYLRLVGDDAPLIGPGPRAFHDAAAGNGGEQRQKSEEFRDFDHEHSVARRGRRPGARRVPKMP